MKVFSLVAKETRRIRWSTTKKTFKVFVSTIIIIVIVVLILFIFSTALQAIIDIL